MTTNPMRALAALSFLALAAAPALAHEGHLDTATPAQAATASEATNTAQAPQAQMLVRAADNMKATQSAHDAKPALMFEKPFQKWWTEE